MQREENKCVKIISFLTFGAGISMSLMLMNIISHREGTFERKQKEDFRLSDSSD